MKKVECISVFDMLKIGVGPSSSHTLGPWRASQRWIEELKDEGVFEEIQKIEIHLYGSLSLTGKGHATDIAAVLGLSGFDPVSMDTLTIDDEIDFIKAKSELYLDQKLFIQFNFENDIVFHKHFLDFHPNGIMYKAITKNTKVIESYFYSIGGGFVVKEERENAKQNIEDFKQFPFSIENAAQLEAFCEKEQKSIAEIVLENERSLRTDQEIDVGLKAIWDVMLESMYLGCHTEGTLPGGLNVTRRATSTNQKLLAENFEQYETKEEWLETIRKTEVRFRQILQWVSCFAISVNEVNASLGRVVTSPTNGSSGTMPAVLMYYLCIENHQAGFNEIKRFMLVAGEIGSLFKKGATISAAMGGCQAEIGVSSAMAAGALCDLMGGTTAQVLMASEIAMEHHLGLTCDPIAGLVQIPCIERNAMGAIKAINAAEIAIESDATKAKIPLDKVINTMWETAKDMSSRYKETSEGGLAVQVMMSDC
ncbi:L-serine ammonia-lyase [Psychroflexus salis]|uniref:L-serine dehydratase n=1 Tax=Psychroflexus salis TaxID=1526574 RepID=A0A916ZR39_9FLAO|nr:L-serine ammonia-lyase [Psychroflexus salis]GGE10072.1 L-serine ammonia-lyase [Psychroflexus salis]